MPITPVHLGILAPLNHFFPKKVSNLAFILVTLWLDASAIGYYALGLDMGEFHGPETHSLGAAMALSGIIALIGCGYYFLDSLIAKDLARGEKAFSWLYGAYLGGLTHILLDAMVHAEMQPFHPVEGNPFYWNGMFWLSLILVPPLVWLIPQYVSCAVRHVQAHLEVRKLRNLEP